MDINKKHRILIASTQYPFYGGAATNAYALIKFFRSYGYKTAGLFITGAGNPINPDNLEGIFNLPTYNEPVNRLAEFINRYLGGNPNVMLGKNYQAPITLKKMFQNQVSGYLVAGSPQMAELAEQDISAQKFLNSNKALINIAEKECMKIVDLIFPNNPIGYKLLMLNYNNYNRIQPPVDTSFAMNNYTIEKKPFKDRKYDIIFICSRFDRAVKNSKLAVKLMKDPLFKNNKKIVVGNLSNEFIGIKNITIAGFIKDGMEILNLLNDTKVLICTSYYDASPNVVKEAIVCGCNVLLSKNCGWYEKYPKEFVCEDVYEIDEWKDKLNYLINNDIEFSYDIKKEKEKIIKGLQIL